MCNWVPMLCGGKKKCVGGNNNKKLKRAPVSAIMKKAGNRGRLVKKLTANK